MPTLAPCAARPRFTRENELTCPFCGVASAPPCGAPLPPPDGEALVLW